MRGVNNTVHTKSEIKLSGYMRTDQRPPAPYQRGPGTSAVLSGTRGHGPSHLLPPCAFPGPHEPPRAAGRSRPRDGPDSHASEAAAQPPCELRAVASAFRARPPNRPKRPHLLRRPARARSDLKLPQLPYRPRLRQLRQRLAAAERRPSGGLNACGARQAGLCESGEVSLRGWCNVRPVKRMLVRVSRWLDACMCTCI